MKRICFLVLLLPVLLFSEVMRREAGNLVIEEIPNIPERITERTNQYQNIRSAALVDWDPAGTGMMISTRFGDVAQLHSVSTPGAYRKQITFFKEPITTASYSPARKDGFVFSMDQGGGEFYQFYWYDLDQGTATVWTSGGETRQESFLWANSGTRAVFSSTKRNGKDFDLYVMESVDASSARLLKQTEGKWGAIDWSPDDSQFLVLHYISINESYLYVVDSKTGEMTEINPTGRTKKIYYGDARFARDRKGIYYTSDEDDEFLRLTYYDLATGKKDIVSSLSWDIKTLDVSKDGKWIAYGANEGGISRLYLAGISNIAKPQQLDLPVGVINSLKFDWQSTRLGFNLSSAQTPSDVFSVDLKSKKIARWTFSEIGGLNPEKFVSPKLIQYPTFDSVNGKPRMIPATTTGLQAIPRNRFR